MNVSNNVLKRAFADGVAVTPVKLQRILYLVASYYGQMTGRPLLHEPFQVWANGPVIRSVYDKFNCFGGREIAAFAKDATGRAFSVDEMKHPDLAQAIDRIWAGSRSLSSTELSAITQSVDSAWSAAHEQSREHIGDDEVMHDHSYRQLFELA